MGCCVAGGWCLYLAGAGARFLVWCGWLVWWLICLSVELMVDCLFARAFAEKQLQSSPFAVQPAFSATSAWHASTTHTELARECGTATNLVDPTAASSGPLLLPKKMISQTSFSRNTSTTLDIVIGRNVGEILKEVVEACKQRSIGKI